MLKLLKNENCKYQFLAVYFVGLLNLYLFLLYITSVYKKDMGILDFLFTVYPNYMLIVSIILILISTTIILYSSTKIIIYNAKKEIFILRLIGKNYLELIKPYLIINFTLSLLGSISAFILFILIKRNNSEVILLISNKYTSIIIYYLIFVILCITITYFACKHTINSYSHNSFKKNNKKFNKSYLEYWKKWNNLSYRFRWNYRDLRRTATRSSAIVLTITIYTTLVILISALQPKWTLIINELLFGLSMYFIILLYNLETLASIERKNDIEIMKTLGFNSNQICKIIMTQIKWMTMRGVFLGIMISCGLIMLYNHYLDEQILKINFLILFILVGLVVTISLLLNRVVIKNIHLKKVESTAIFNTKQYSQI